MKWQFKESKAAIKDGARTGKIAGAAVLASAALAGYIENRDAIAPLNAISHAAWGESAFDQNTLSLKYTGSAIAIHDSAMFGWGAIFEWLCGDAAERGEVGKTLLGATFVSALAYVVDYKIAPPRFSPGIERHLSRRALFAVYFVLALVLATGSLSRRR